MKAGRSFRLPEPGSPEISVTPDLLRGPRVEVDGRSIRPKRDGATVYWPVELEDGSERRLRLAGALTGLRAIVDGRAYAVERPLSAWETVLAVVPIGLVPFVVGGFGLLTGGIVTGLSFALFRLAWPPVARFAGWAALVTAALLAGYLAAPLMP